MFFCLFVLLFFCFVFWGIRMCVSTINFAASSWSHSSWRPATFSLATFLQSSHHQLVLPSFVAISLTCICSGKYTSSTILNIEPFSQEYFPQQAVSDTAMDIQEAENGTETSKFTHQKEFRQKKKNWKLTFFQATPRPQQQAPQPHLLPRWSMIKIMWTGCFTWPFSLLHLGHNYFVAFM